MEEIKKIIISYYNRVYSTKLENLDEKNCFLDRYDISKLNQEQVNYLNRFIAHGETEVVIKNLPTKKAQGQKDLVQNSTRPSKIQYSSNYSIKWKQKEHYLTCSMKPQLF